MARTSVATGAQASWPEHPLPGRFVVHEEFAGGEGWSGVVSTPAEPSRRLFLKVLPPGVELAEASLLASLEHPQIPRVLETGITPDGRPFLLRELIVGQPLQATFPLPVEQVVILAEQLLEVLAYVHLRGILHLDLKPANVVRAQTQQGARYHLLDFGLGRRGGGHAPGGTVFFTAPETLLGLPASARSDLFALGALLFVALRTPREMPSLSRFLHAFPQQDFFAATGTSVASLPAELRHILPRLLARRPQERFADAQEALEAFTFGSGRPQPTSLAPDPITVFGDDLLRVFARGPADMSVRVRGGSPADRQALALHAACSVASVQRVTVEDDACVVERGDERGDNVVEWDLPRLSLSDIAAHLENVLDLDAASAHRAADVLLAAGADTPAALREMLQALVESGRIVPHGVRFIWPDAIAGRVRLSSGSDSLQGDITALAARGAVAQANATFRAQLRGAPQRERALREALALGFLQGGEPARALPLVHDLGVLRVNALLDLGRVRDAEFAFAALPQDERASSPGQRLEAALANARGEFAHAEQLLRQDEVTAVGDARVALGLVLSNRGQLEEAKAVLHTVLPELSEARPLLRAAALTNLAEVCRRQGDLAASRTHHRHALQLLQDVGHVRYTAVAAANLGVVAKDLGQLDEAIEHQRRAKTLFAHIGDVRGAALAEANLGVASLAAADVELAVRRLRRAADELQALGAHELLPLVRAFFARALAAAGQHAEARAVLATIEPAASDRVAEQVHETLSLLAPSPLQVPVLQSPVMQVDTEASPAPQTLREDSIPRGVFRTFLAVNRRLASEANLERAMEYLLEAAVTLAGARTGLLLVVRKDGVRLEVRAGDAPPQGFAFSRSLVHRAIQTRRPITGEEAQADRSLMEMPSVRGLSIKSVLCVPFVSASGTEGALYVEHAGRPGVFGEVEKEHLEVLADQAAIAVDRMVREEQLAAELERSRRSLEVVHRTMKRARAGSLIGDSPPMRALKEQVRKLAPNDLAVLIVGETGTGKELVARALHEQSLQSAAPFVSVNCAAIPAELMESELFGHVKGAFTGADEDRRGLMELAAGGTLFLDEIGDMPLPMQAKLLRALQDGSVRPVGSGETRPVAVRVLAATHRDLRAMIEQGQFRQDLYYRVAGAELVVPPLRARGEDVLAISHDMLRRLGEQHRRELRLSERGKAKLLRYAWPGNVRELEHLLARVAILSEGAELDDTQLPDPVATAVGAAVGAAATWPVINMQEAEERTIRAALQSTGGDKTAAAKVLGISRTALYDKLKRMNASRSE
jgi:transcriptional regulator with GAF, ATPase, and Fis domain